MKIATCVPLPFEPNEHFFSRDSGLLCRGFNAIGASAFVVMPNQTKSIYSSFLLSADINELESYDWWKEQRFDLVILYGWGSPEFFPIAKAIRASGAILIQNLDTVGLFSPYADFKKWLKISICWINRPINLKLRLKAIYQVSRDLFPSIYEEKRIKMLLESDYISCVSPFATNRVKSYTLRLGGSALEKKVYMAPHPVNLNFQYNHEVKHNVIVAVGRWDASGTAQKNPELLIQVLRKIISQNPDWTAHIIGREASLLKKKYLTDNPSDLRNISFTDFVNHEELKSIYTSSKIILCVSRHESFHISSAEALCCGCSVVVPKRISLGSTAWFTSNNSGTLCEDYSKKQIIIGLNKEIALWKNNERCPQTISQHWGSILKANHVAERFLSLAYGGGCP